jgi:hypothetical protein
MTAETVSHVTMLCLTVWMLVGVALADYPAAPGSGGTACTYNAHCGIPAANCYSLRSLSLYQLVYCR